ncbi:hypothetical protein [Streptococcus danieliae]|uniref:hypothetical protein n=1 Tax=Streptococcus danieliae TaxID=747656 RepID=UPI0021C7F52A|nr:hypothetical protein [Streptococcus danieliae]MCU0082468.1 hypothetical protein [Streptococcus danieliae]
MSNYRVKHFEDYLLNRLEDTVNDFIKENAIEVLKYTFVPVVLGSKYLFVGTLEYEELDHED